MQRNSRISRISVRMIVSLSVINEEEWWDHMFSIFLNGNLTKYLGCNILSIFASLVSMGADDEHWSSEIGKHVRRFNHFFSCWCHIMNCREPREQILQIGLLVRVLQSYFTSSLSYTWLSLGIQWLAKVVNYDCLNMRISCLMAARSFSGS